MKKIVNSLKGVLVFSLKLLFVIFILSLFFFGPIIAYWTWEENENVASCVKKGETYDKCYELYNW